jgi:very-short-patch-repair endonuclease
MSQDEPQTDRARRLRRDWTKAEARLWLSLRNRRLDGFKFRRQVPIDRYFADFACLEARLLIELDGGQHADAVDYDAARTAVLEHAGFHVLRFWNHHVLTELDGVLQEISAALRSARP